MKKIKIPLGDRSYYVYIGFDILPKLGKIIKGLGLGEKGAIITDSNVKNHWLLPLQKSLALDLPVCTLPPGEPSKSIDIVKDIYSQLLKWGLNRYSFLIALGGGVVGDITGFIAATYMRGISYIQIPTTLMAQVDSSIGGKTAVNLSEGKNLVGCFWQPRVVFTDTKTLTTLPKDELKAGLAEVIKYGIIKSAGLFRELEKKAGELYEISPGLWESIITRCARIKADVVKADERELTGLRAILNYGHTIGHALEAAEGYRDITHGEAVGFGIVCAARLSFRLGVLSKKDMERQIELVKKLSLTVSQYKPGLYSKIMESLKYDKKVKGGKPRFVLSRKIGEVFLTDKITMEDVSAVLEEL